MCVVSEGEKRGKGSKGRGDEKKEGRKNDERGRKNQEGR
jgi:hypothetical protein